MPKTMECKEPNCGETVVYEPHRVTGAAFLEYGKNKTAGRGAEKTVYLTCPRGHLHAYTVKEEGQK